MGEEGGVLLAPIGSDWSTAFKAFRAAFEEKTGVCWEERFDREKRGAVGKRVMGDGRPFFVYPVPRAGKAVGRMPVGKTAAAGGDGD